MRRLAILPLLALAGCGHHAEEETQTTVTKNGVTTTTITTRAVDRDSTGGGLKIDADKFKANLEIPRLTFGGDHVDLDGMKLYPGSRVKGVHVHAVDHPGNKRGVVVMDFASPAAPMTVAQHMADQARKAGFTVTANTAAEVDGTKRGGDETKTFSATLHPDGSATVGQLTLSGTKR